LGSLLANPFGVGQPARRSLARRLGSALYFNQSPGLPRPVWQTGFSASRG